MQHAWGGATGRQDGRAHRQRPRGRCRRVTTVSNARGRFLTYINGSPCARQGSSGEGRGGGLWQADGYDVAGSVGRRIVQAGGVGSGCAAVRAADMAPGRLSRLGRGLPEVEPGRPARRPAMRVPREMYAGQAPVRAR